MVSVTQLRRKLQRDGWTGLASAVTQRIFRGADSVDENALIFDLFEGRRGGVMIDVGACHGSALRPFAESGWRIFAFEPDPGNRTVLLENVQRQPRVEVLPEAIGESDGDVLNFYASPESPGISSLTPFRSSHVKIAEVRTTRLDTFLQGMNVDDVDYLKVDAEGHDLFVLRTFPFERMRPRVVLCEFEDRKTAPLGYRMADMADLLVAAGYDVIVSEWYPIERYGVRHRWRSFARYPTSLTDENAWGNLVAVDKSGRHAAAGQIFGI